jgi:hypothetical protein
VFLPESARRRGFTGVLVPPDAAGYPTGGNEVGEAVVVDVDGPLAAVGDELAVDTDGAELMLLPFSTLRAGCGFTELGGMGGVLCVGGGDRERDEGERDVVFLPIEVEV